jgi:hypothetical protein
MPDVDDGQLILNAQQFGKPPECPDDGELVPLMCTKVGGHYYEDRTRRTGFGDYRSFNYPERAVVPTPGWLAEKLLETYPEFFTVVRGYEPPPDTNPQPAVTMKLRLVGKSTHSYRDSTVIDPATGHPPMTWWWNEGSIQDVPVLVGELMLQHHPDNFVREM